MHDLKIPFGPQHSSLKEPVYFKVYTKGSLISDVKVRAGYVHRGMEKLVEGQETITAIHSCDKICGICSFVHNACCTYAVEKILRFNTTISVKMTRMIIGELERIHSHLMWLGFMFHEIGLETFFMYFWREREKVLELFELITGQRIHHSINWITTTKYSITKKSLIKDYCSKIKEKVIKYKKDIISSRVIKSRFKEVGVISKDLARKYSIVGPNARASGVSQDIRETGYEGYNHISFNVVVRDEGDVFARILARIDEVIESIKIINQALDLLNEEVPPKKETFIKRGSGFARLEAPRGELFYYLSVKKNIVERIKIKTPTFANFPILPEIMKGETLSEVPVIIASIDPCIGCMERIFVSKDGNESILSSEEFRRRFCNEHHHH